MSEQLDIEQLEIEQLEREPFSQLDICVKQEVLDTCQTDSVYLVVQLRTKIILPCKKGPYWVLWPDLAIYYF